MSKHTPGPWKLLGGGETTIVYARDQKAAIGRTAFLDRPHPEAWANLQLAAAAPELLEALGTLAAFPLESFNYANDPDSKEIFGANGEWTLTVGVIRKARAAIAKAAGETQ